MRVVEVGQETALARVAADPRIADIIDVISRNRELLAFVLTTIRTFHWAAELRGGRQGGNLNLRQLLETHVRKSDKRSRRAAERIAAAIEGLYRDENEGNVRGALLEAFVEDRLRSRYHAAGCLLRNNLRFELEESNHTLYSSGAKSIDVIGFDGRRGECHDCKVDPRRFEKDWIEELEREVAPRGFMIGLATAYYLDNARYFLKCNDIRLRLAQLLDARRLFNLLPLQP